jgi:glucose dehydrogenase
VAESNFDADVIVIGSGLVGSLAAYELAKAGKSVLILEAGPRVKLWEALENYRNAPVKLGSTPTGGASPFPNADYAPNPFRPYLVQTGPVPFGTNYLRIVGGSTWHWESALYRFIPNDFRLKTLYGQGRDWPLSYDDIEPYYVRAEYEIGVNGDDNEDMSGHGGAPFPPRSAPYPMKVLPYSYMETHVANVLSKAGHHPLHEPNGRASRPYDGRPTCAGNNTCSPICPINSRYSGITHVEKAERAGAKVIDQAVVYRIQAGVNRKIAAVHYKKPDGTSHRLTARSFVLAAHGVEGPKLLLISDGVANSSDMVGRNLMDHTGISVDMESSEAVWPGRGPSQLLIFLDHRDGPFRREHSGFKVKLRSGVPNRDITKELLEKGVLGSKLDQQIRYQSGRVMDFAVDPETLPDPANRVTASKTRTDALGIPLPEIYYDVDDYWKKGRQVALGVLHEYAGLLGATIKQEHQAPQNRRHIIGTTIMGTDPKNSVVNPDCRTHDHDNLFIAGTSVMPSASCVNPTLTAAALSIRMAATIAAEV